MSGQKKRTEIDQIVINWHVNEACNYRCRYCYAKWDNLGAGRDLIRDHEATKQMLTALWAFFAPSNQSNLLRSVLDWKRVRLNFAGGEPLLNKPSLIHAIGFARSLGFDVSIITNGSLLDQETADQLAPDLEWLGISIDALEQQTNTDIGRVDRRGNYLDVHALAEIVAASRSSHPSMKVKLNTVVSASNYAGKLSSILDRLQPQKWKILRMLPMVSDDGVVTDAQFDQFVSSHLNYSNIMRVERNEDMLQTYVMIDPKGRFYQNSPDAQTTGYLYSRSINNVGAAAAFSDVPFSPVGFLGRYN